MLTKPVAEPIAIDPAKPQTSPAPVSPVLEILLTASSAPQIPPETVRIAASLSQRDSGAKLIPFRPHIFQH